MNKAETQRKRNNNARLFDWNSTRHVNCVRLSVGNSLRHEIAKIGVCYQLQKMGHEFLTEAKTKNRSGRVDIVDLDDGMIYEVVESEKKQSILEKGKRYPLPIIVVSIPKEVKK